MRPSQTAAVVVLSLVPAFTLAIFDIANLPAQLQPIIQQGYIETSFDDYLTAHNGYWEGVDSESFSEDIFGKHKGTTITRTRPGLKAPVVVAASNSGAQTPPNNGVTAADFSVEQYTFAPIELTDGINLDLIGTNFAIVDRFYHQTDVSFHQATQSIDLLARDTYIAGYAAANTIAASTVAAGAGVNLTVDDIRGFDTVITVGAGGTNGVVVPTSGAAPLPAFVYPAGSMTGSFPISVTLATPAGTNLSNYVPFINGVNPYGTPGAPTAARGNGISGVLQMTVPAGKAINPGDVITAGDGPNQIFSAGVLHFAKLPPASSSLTQTLLLDAVGQLQSDAVPYSMNRHGEDEGTYLAHISPKVMRSLYFDPDFKQANQTLGMSAVYIKGKVSQYLGVTFLENTNVPRISLTPYGGTGFAYLTIVAGQGAIIDAPYEGLEDWANSAFNPGYVAIEHGIAQILMP
ncbi:MAG: hypothetical protein JWO85_3381, partial [Candidatus Eremiobacteraeota bacterium]|nr:hypothetical protein [Candidatus Eremiobacteraeota bacterium]